MAFILPKGIVVNAPDATESIERINAQPLDPEDIAKFWKVYTTTRRRLLDPTAERLENYWWRIWGSQRRELNGATIARLFADISDGQSFVPLRGPANRDEGTPPLNSSTRHSPGAASSTAIHRPSQRRPSTTSSTASKAAPAPMPHPILKKTRGPSSTGPRPTARFISPHESDAETANTTNSSNISESPNSHVVVQPPSPDSQNSKTDKKASGGAKKKGRIVTSTAVKKRPVITRRQGSQSSGDSATKIDSQNDIQSPTERVSPTCLEASHGKGKGKALSKFEEAFSPDNLATLPKKSASSKSVDSERTSPRQRGQKGSGQSAPESVTQGEKGSSSGLRHTENQQISHQEIPEEELELQRTILKEANARVRTNPRTASHQVIDENEDLRVSRPTLATTSDGTHGPDMGGVRLKSAVSVGATFADATGELELGDSAPPLPQVTGAQGKNKGKGRDPNDMFAKRAVPSASNDVAATTSSDGPLAKSKSHLTLLLQKDRARSGEQKPADGKKRE